MDIRTDQEIKEDKKKVGETAVKGKHKAWIATYVVVSLLCLVFYFLLRFKFFNVLGTYRLLLQRLSIAAFFVFIVLIVAKSIEGIVAKRSHTAAVSYNVIRLIRLLSVVIAIFVVVTFVFVNWYTAAV